jgi:hypothetical protein
MPKDKDKPVYLLGNEGPVLKIALPQKSDVVVLKGLLMAHSGLNLVKKSKTA